MSCVCIALEIVNSCYVARERGKRESERERGRMLSGRITAAAARHGGEGVAAVNAQQQQQQEEEEQRGRAG